MRDPVLDLRDVFGLLEYKIAHDAASGLDVYRVAEVLNTSMADLKVNKRYVPTGDLILTPMNGGHLAKLLGPDQYVPSDRTLIISHLDGTVSVDSSEAGWGNHYRRANKVGTRNYTIAQPYVSYDGKLLELTKVLRSLMKHDKRITPAYKILGSDVHHGQTVGHVLGLKDPIHQIATQSHGAITMYHGTSFKRWEVIKKQGLRPNKTPEPYADLISGYSEYNVYLTLAPSTARNYATRASVDDRSPAVVLSVEVNDWSKFVPDEDAVTIGWFEWEGMELHFRGGWRKRPDADKIWAMIVTSFITGLREAATVAYKGAIAASKIKLFEQFKPVGMKKDPSDEEYTAAMAKTQLKHFR